MDGFLNFLADLILFTAGIIVLILWLVIFVGAAIEIYDWLTGDKKNAEGEIDLDDTGEEG